VKAGIKNFIFWKLAVFGSGILLVYFTTKHYWF